MIAKESCPFCHGPALVVEEGLTDGPRKLKCIRCNATCDIHKYSAEEAKELLEALDRTPAEGEVVTIREWKPKEE